MSQDNQKKVGLNLDMKSITEADYRELVRSCKIELKIVEKTGQCKHNVGETYVYQIPYRRPENVCYALMNVVDMYIWRVALGFPSWNAENRDVYRIHCPDATGTIWEMRRIE